MKFLRIAWASVLTMLLSAPSLAAVKNDLAGLAICSRLKAMPKGYRATNCSRRTPLRGECRFTMTSNDMPIEYLLDNGTVLSKSARLYAGAKFAAPFGLRVSDNFESARRRVERITGLSFKLWTDDQNENAHYLQSDAVVCNKNKSYSIYVWFKNDRTTGITVSTLPAI